MTAVRLQGAGMRIAGCVVAVVAAVLSMGLGSPPTPHPRSASLLDSHLRVSWHGNPHSSRMCVLGTLVGAERADGLRRQAAGCVPLTDKHVQPAYQLVTVIAQPRPPRTASGDGGNPSR